MLLSLFILNIAASIAGFLFFLVPLILSLPIEHSLIFNLYFTTIIVQSILLVTVLNFIRHKNGIVISFEDLFIHINSKIRYLLIILLIVGVFVVFSGVSDMSGGGPEIIEGKYFLVDKGRILREISYEAYTRYELLNFRITSYMAFLINVIDVILIYFASLITTKKTDY